MNFLGTMRSKWGIPVALGVIGLLCVGVVIGISRPQVYVYLTEDVLFALDPSADRAYGYAERHFSARRAADYDLGRAMLFFQKTIQIDPHYPTAYHEMARISFLKDDLYLAHEQINKEFEVNPHPSPASYYIRALIKAYRKDYVGAAEDYETYFTKTPANWAGINDYSWVLLKADLPQGALDALDWGLKQWPHNAWLLNNRATALYELGRYDEAEKAALAAQPRVEALTTADWLIAYPGNDPLIAPQGLASFKEAARQNLVLIATRGKSRTP